MVVSMIACATSLPNYAAAKLSAGASLNAASVTALNTAGTQWPAVTHSAGLPASPSFAASVNGAMQAVFSYGGAMVFPEFMSEMRRPRDFLKGMWAAQAFIYVVYMVRLDCPQVMTLLSDVFLGLRSLLLLLPG